MKTIISILFFLAIGLKSFSQTTSSLVVFVIDSETSEPITDAAVTIRESGYPTEKTTSDGRALFENNAPIGEIHYLVRKTGYVTKEGEFNITTIPKNNTLTVRLSKTTVPQEDKILIMGEVQDNAGNDLEGAVVEAKIRTNVKSVTTDKSGNYWIEISLDKSYPSNSLQIEVKYKDCLKYAETISLTRDPVITKSLRLDCNSSTKINPSKRSKKGEGTGINTQINNGIQVTITTCELRGRRLIVSLLYENVSSESFQADILFGKEMNTLYVDGDSYMSISHTVANNTPNPYGYTHYFLGKGFSVKGQVEFYVGNSNFNTIGLKLASDHVFYDIPVTK